MRVVAREQIEEAMASCSLATREACTVPAAIYRDKDTTKRRAKNPDNVIPEISCE